MNYIFLDVDGVLNSSSYFKRVKKHNKTLQKLLAFLHMKFNCKLHLPWDNLNPDNLDILSKIYNIGDSKIVLISTWGICRDKEDSVCYSMYKYLEKTLAKYGMKIDEVMNPINRPKNIKKYVDTRLQSSDNFVILDDDFGKEKYEELNLDSHLIHPYFWDNNCNVEDGGLRERHYQQALKILGD